MSVNDIGSIAEAYYKDKILSETLKRFQSEFDELLKTEAEVRRAKAKEIVMQLAKLNVALRQLEITYKSIQSQVGECKAVDDYILMIKVLIEKLSYEKNNHKL